MRTSFVGFIACVVSFASLACDAAVASQPEKPPAKADDPDPKKADPTPPAKTEPEEEVRPPLPGVTFQFSACTTPFERARDCGIAKVPVDYGNPGGKTIDLFVARLGSTDPNATQMYMLQGGPGGSALGLVDIAVSALAERPNLELILVEHRGVGRSSILGCPNTDADPETPSTATARAVACSTELQSIWGADLGQFTTSNAARDVAVTVAALRKPAQKAFVYGVSYGTYWAHRFLQVSPTKVDGVILDSAVPPTDSFSNFNDGYDPVLRRLADACKANAQCAARLGADPFARMSAIIAGAGSSKCGVALALDRDGMDASLASMLVYPETAELVPSFLARFARCTTDDETAVNNVLNWLFPPAGGGEDPPRLDSDPLYYNIVFGELWTDPAPTRTSLEKDFSARVIATKGPLDLDDVRLGWPRYKSDVYLGQWAKSSMPVLTLNGDLDVQTPIESARQYETMLTGANKFFVFVPNANHATISQSRPREGKRPCGLEVILEFIDAPTARPTAKCTATTMPPNLDGNPDWVTPFYGTPAAWASAPKVQSRNLRNVTTPREDVLRALEDLGRRTQGHPRRGIAIPTRRARRAK